jgi:predicted nucleotidyltransferase
MMPDQQILDELVRRIVEAVQPLEIILFGSAARGEMTSDSDIDLLVVMPEGTHKRHTAGFIRSRLYGLGVPVDIVVATPSTLEMYGRSIGLIYLPALEEGKHLYAV